MDWQSQLVSIYLNYRINQLAGVYPILLESILKKYFGHKFAQPIYRFIDSFPVILTKGQSSYKARVSPGLASQGYCVSRGEFYYGVKVPYHWYE